MLLFVPVQSSQVKPLTSILKASCYSRRPSWAELEPQPFLRPKTGGMWGRRGGGGERVGGGVIQMVEHLGQPGHEP